MARLFGTDGVRGLANRDLTAELATKLAQAAAIILGEDARARGIKPKAVIGRDPRISGEFLAAAISSGLASSGVDVFDAGVLPTPATAFLTDDLDADFGVMISASHNPAPDNGIKFFARGGHKLADEIEDQIEAAMSAEPLAPVGAAVGRKRAPRRPFSYVSRRKRLFDQRSSSGSLPVLPSHSAASGSGSLRALSTGHSFASSALRAT